jgi:hypothetical protein
MVLDSEQRKSSASNEIRIGNGAHVTQCAVITKDVSDNQRVSGSFPIEHSRFVSFIKRIF